MGKVIDVGFEKIYPTEDDISLSTFLDLLNVPIHNLPPVIAREMEGLYFILDGRHRTWRKYLSEERNIALYIPDSPSDIMTKNQFPEISEKILNESNRYIGERWDEAVLSAASMGLLSVPDFYKMRLLPKRKFMTSLVDCITFSAEERPRLYYSIFGE